MSATRYTGRIHNNVRHGKACACPLCDPGGVQLAAARTRAASAPTVVVKVVSTPEGPAVLARRPSRYHPPLTPQAHRMSQLLREGKTAAQAIEIIEFETASRKATT